jgi:hypothetical protein
MVAISPAAPASAGPPLSWGAEKGPDDPPAGITKAYQIVDMANVGDTFYAATIGAATGGSPANPTFKSTDGGATWTVLTHAASGGFEKIAVAPDDANQIVAIDQGTTPDTVYYSSNGGGSFSDMGLASDMPTMTNLYCIDISEGPVTAVVAGGSDNGSVARLYLYEFKGFSPAWKEKASTANGFEAGQEAVNAAIFSPNWSVDSIILTVTDPTAAGNALFQVFWNESGKWNDDITGYIDYTAANLAIAALAAGEDILSASIATPSSYLGFDEGERLAFIGLATSAGAGDGVYRFSDNFKGNFALWNGAAEGPIHSVAYHDAGKLLAGDYNQNQVFVALSPLGNNPKFERVNSFKQPGGDASGDEMTLVGWNGDTAVAATMGNESAFATSTDDGYAFNDISMVNTTIADYNDFAVSNPRYVTTDDGTDASVWLNDGGWKRVLSLTGKTKLLVRAAPDDFAAVYLSEPTTTNMWVSKNSGMTTWKSIPCYKLNSVTDFVVESPDVVYAVGPAGGPAAPMGASKTTNAGSSWGSARQLGTPSGNIAVVATVTLAPNGDVLAGGTAGNWAVSADGGSSFTYKKKGGGDPAAAVHLVADDDYADNGIVYIGRGTQVTRSNAPPGPFPQPGITAGYAVTGIAQVDGIVYVVASNGANSEMHRCLNLKTATPTGKNVPLWSCKDPAAGVTLNATPRALQATSDHKLWAIDTTSEALYGFADPIALTAPTLNAPADEYVIMTNPTSGIPYDVTFSFTRQNDQVTLLDFQIATDPDFDAIVVNDQVTANVDILSGLVGPTSSFLNGATNIAYMPGQTYYWRVRVAQNGPLYSPWSEVRELDVEGAIMFAIEGPMSGATGVSLTPTLVWTEYPGIIHYEVAVAEDPTFAILDFTHTVEPDKTFYKVPADEALKYSTTYYWRVRGVTGVAPPAGKGQPPNPTPAGEWVTGVFTTMAEPVEDPGPDTIVVEPPDVTVEPPEVVVQPAEFPIPTYLLWIIVAIGAILIIALIVLIVRTRRVV